MSLIRKANTIDEEGSTTTGYFIDDMLCGFILGCVVTSLFAIFIFCCIKGCVQEENYIIPKKATKGSYIQLNDGKLWKKQ